MESIRTELTGRVIAGLRGAATTLLVIKTHLVSWIILIWIRLIRIFFLTLQNLDSAVVRLI